VLPCSPVRLALEPPPGNWIYEWHCAPYSAPFCEKVRRLAEDAGYNAFVLEVPLGEVAGAAKESLGGPDSWSEIYIEGWAYAISGIIYAVAKSKLYFNLEASSLVQVPGPRVFSPLDPYIRLASIVETCGGAMPFMMWAYHYVGSSKDWVPMPYAGSLPRLKLPGYYLKNPDTPQADSPQPGEYIIRSSLADDRAKVEIFFEISIIPIPPPVAVISAPHKAATACDVTLDASASSDPGGASLHYSWGCVRGSGPQKADLEDVTSCQDLAAVATKASSPIFTILGYKLGPGSYDISVLVRRSDANTTKTVTLNLVQESGSKPPVVSWAEPPAKVSPQQPFHLAAVVGTSEACAAPSWKTWWFLNVSDEGEVGRSATFLHQSDAEPSLLISPPFPVPPGRYILRLLFSDGVPDFGAWSGGDTRYTFDSAPFVVDSPPVGGRCVVYPSVGNVTLTPFRLMSTLWVDEDLPLQHRFQWRSGRICDGNEGSRWTLLRPWSQSDEFINVLMGVSGFVTIKAEAMDALGSASEALGQTQVLKLTRLPEQDLLIDMLDVAIATGDPFTMLTSASAIGNAVAESGEGRSGAKLSAALLDIVEGSGVLADPTPDVIDQATSVLVSVMAAASARILQPTTTTPLYGPRPTTTTTTATEPLDPVDFGVVKKAAGLIGSIAGSARLMPSGLGKPVAESLLGTMGLLLKTVAVDPYVITNGIGVSGPPIPPVEEKEKQHYLSLDLKVAADNVGSALLKGMTMGQSMSIESVYGGPTLVLQRANATDMLDEGTSLGRFSLPPLANATLLDPGGRRLSSNYGAGGPLDCPPGYAGATGLELQETRWPGNPVGYVGTSGVATQELERPILPTTYWFRKGVENLASVEESCCDISEDTVVTIALRACGRTLEFANLSLTFSIPLGTRPSASSSLTETRLCQWFNMTSRAWTDEGCRMKALMEDSVLCTCDHISTFTAAWGGFTTTFNTVVHCTSVKILGGTAFANISAGGWMSRSAGVIFLLLCTLVVFLSFGALLRNCRTQFEFAISRRQFLEMLAVEEEDVQQLAFSRQRIYKSATKYTKPRIAATLLWHVLHKWFNLTVAPIEDWTMKNPLDGLSMALAILILKETAAWDVRLARSDAYSLVMCSGMKKLALPKEGIRSSRNSLSSALGGIELLMEAYGESLADARSEFLATDHPKNVPRLRFWSLFKTYHPLVEIARPSIVSRRSVLLVAMMMRIFGTIGWISVFFIVSTDSVFSWESAEQCDSRPIGMGLPKDIWVAIVSSMIAHWFPLLVVMLHNRRRPFRIPKNERRRDSAVRTCEDFFLCVAGLLYCGLWLGVTVSFLANVGDIGGTHWAISAVFHFLKAWLLTPLLFAIARYRFMKRVIKNEAMQVNIGEVMEKLLVSERNVSKTRVYAYDDEGRPVMRPVWLDDLSKGIFEKNEAVQQFSEWAHTEATIPPPSPVSPAAIASLSMTGARAWELPPPDSPPTLALGPWSPSATITSPPAQRALPPPLTFSSGAATRRGKPQALSLEDETLSPSTAGRRSPGGAVMGTRSVATPASAASGGGGSEEAVVPWPGRRPPEEGGDEDDGVPIEVADGCFQQWAEEWSSMQHSEIYDRGVKLSVGNYCTLPISPARNRKYEETAKKRGLDKQGGRPCVIKDGRQPLAWKHGTESPIWVEQWKPPEHHVAPPLTSWAALAAGSPPRSPVSQRPARTRRAATHSPLGRAPRPTNLQQMLQRTGTGPISPPRRLVADPSSPSGLAITGSSSSPSRVGVAG